MTPYNIGRNIVKKRRGKFTNDKNFLFEVPLFFKKDGKRLD